MNDKTLNLSSPRFTLQSPALLVALQVRLRYEIVGEEEQSIAILELASDEIVP